MALQIFGTRKCAATRKAERFFKERDVAYHFVDLVEKGVSAGELDAISAAVGLGSLIDEGSKRFKDRGLAYMDYDPREEILSDPSLLNLYYNRIKRGIAVSVDVDDAIVVWGRRDAINSYNFV